MYIKKTNKLTDIENKLVVTGGEGEEGGANRVLGLKGTNYYV